jgi:ATP-binding cassette subfamily B protein
MKTEERRVPIPAVANPAMEDPRYPAPKAWIHPDTKRSWVGRMMPIVLSHKRSLITAWIATLLSALLALAVPWFVRNALNDLIVAVGGPAAAKLYLHHLRMTRVEAEHAFMVVIVVIAVAAVLRFVVGFVYRNWMLRSAYAIEYDLRNTLYQKFMNLSFAFYDRVQSGQLISRANSDIRSVEMFLAFAPTVAIQMVTFVIALVLMLHINVLLTLITLVPLPLVWYFGTKMRRQMFPASWIVQARLAEVATIVDENVTGVRIVKSFAAERREIKKLAETARRVWWANVKLVDIRAAFAPLLQNLPDLGKVGVLFYTGYLVIHRQIDPGAIVVFMGYLIWLTAPFRVLGFLMVLHERAAASAERIYEILDTPSDVYDRPGAFDLKRGEGRVEFRDVRFGYDPDRVILDGFSMHIDPGETVALVGRNGTGKSTAARLLMRFYDVDEGAVLVDGVDLRNVTQQSLRAQLGLVADDAFLFSDTIHNNIAYAYPDATRDDVVKAARAAGADEFIVNLPDGYETIIGERGYDLSGGQRQRIALARLLLKDPEILILDEATSSIDVKTEQEIHDALVTVMEGRTTLIIAHRLSTINLADRIVLLQNGRIVATGTHQELLRTDPRYAATLHQIEEEEMEAAAKGDDRDAPSRVGAEEVLAVDDMERA